MSTTPVPTTDIETLGTQLDVSVGIARSLVASWLPPPKPGEEEEEDEKTDKAVASYAEGRPARLGLGAKFLSHADATRHLSSTTFENKLKRKILNGNQRARGAKDDAEDPWPQKRRQKYEVDEDSKTFAVGKKKAHTNEVVSPGDESTKPIMEEAKKVYKSSDFLSIYLNERAEKKKKKNKKNKNKEGLVGGEGMKASDLVCNK